MKLMLALLVPVLALVVLGFVWHWLWWAALVAGVVWTVGLFGGLAAGEGGTQDIAHIEH